MPHGDHERMLASHTKSASSPESRLGMVRLSVWGSSPTRLGTTTPRIRSGAEKKVTEVSNFAKTHGSGMRCLSVRVRTGVRERRDKPAHCEGMREPYGKGEATPFWPRVLPVIS
jgi:hypothetical protein